MNWSRHCADFSLTHFLAGCSHPPVCPAVPADQRMPPRLAPVAGSKPTPFAVAIGASVIVEPHFRRSTASGTEDGDLVGFRHAVIGTKITSEQGPLSDERKRIRRHQAPLCPVRCPAFVADGVVVAHEGGQPLERSGLRAILQEILVEKAAPVPALEEIPAVDENDLPGGSRTEGSGLFARIRQPNRMSGRMLIFPASAGRRTLERAKGGSMAGSRPYRSRRRGARHRELVANFGMIGRLCLCG